MHSSIIRFFEYWLGQVNKMLKNEVDVIFHRDLFKTAWKVSKYGVFPGPYFPVFGQNTKIYIVNLRIQSEYGEIRTRKNSAFGHFKTCHTVQNVCQTSIRWRNSLLGIRGIPRKYEEKKASHEELFKTTVCATIYLNTLYLVILILHRSTICLLAIKWHKQWLVKYLPSSSVAPNNFWIFFVSLA